MNHAPRTEMDWELSRTPLSRNQPIWQSRASQTKFPSFLASALSLFLTFILSVFVASLLSCASGETPEKVAVTFLELYVFHVDQKSALELASDAAEDKLRLELANVERLRAETGFRPGASRPPIARELEQTDTLEDGTTLYTYRIEIRPKGGTPSVRKMTIHVRRVGKKWRVVDYDFPPS